MSILPLVVVLILRSVVLAADIVVTVPPGTCPHEAEPEFGVALVATRNRVLVGANADLCRQAHVFNARTGALVRTLASPTPDAPGNFGSGVATAGKHLLVSAPGVGQAYLFDGKTGALRQTFANPDTSADTSFGTRLAGTPTRVAVRATSFDATTGETHHAVHVFDAASGALVRTLTLAAPGLGVEFGRGIAALGDELVVGAPGFCVGFACDGSPGAAYVLDPDTGAIRLTLTAPTPVVGDEFGATVANLGHNVLVAATGPRGHAGTVYLFNGHDGRLLQRFSNPAAPDERCFGCALAGRARKVFVGSPSFHSEFDPGPIFGAAYIFDARTGRLRATLVGTQDNGGFGTAVALLRNRTAVAEPDLENNCLEAGGVHLAAHPGATSRTARGRAPRGVTSRPRP